MPPSWAAREEDTWEMAARKEASVLRGVEEVEGENVSERMQEEKMMDAARGG